jgi:beta-lactamase class A
MKSRRAFLAGAAAAAAVAVAAGCSRPLEAGNVSDPARARFEAIRATLGPSARLGVAAIEVGGLNRRLLHDSDSRYAMASTFKLPLAALVLAEAERGSLALTDELSFGRADLLDYAPVVRANLDRGRLSIEQLAAAIVQVSDNTAANLLLRRIGGPEAFTRFVRAGSDPVTRLDRLEPELNSNLPGDPRDTTSPAAMAALVRDLVLGDRLAPASRGRLFEWMESSEPGPDRLRAGLPPAWRFGHKTGTGARGAVNDVGIAWPPGRAPIVIAAYQDGGDAAMPARAAAHAAVARLVVETFA